MPLRLSVLALGGSDCERLRDGLLAQPSNAISSLAYIGAGIWAIAREARTGRARISGLCYGSVLVVVGAGSFAYHGPQFAGANALHDGSNAAAAAFIAGDLVVHRAELGAILRRRATWVAVAALATAALVNVLTRTGAPLCRPDSILQGHAAWHVLTAGALGAWAVARTPDPHSSAVSTKRSAPELVRPEEGW